MQIASSRRTPLSVAPNLASPTPEKPSAFPEDRFEPGWVSAGLSVAGGLISVAGGMTNKPLMVAGGMFLTAASTGATALRVQRNGAMDKAALVSMAGGGGLLAASALLLALPQPTAAPQGPLPELLQKVGVQLF